MTCNTSGPTSTSTIPKSPKPDPARSHRHDRILGIDPGSTSMGWGLLERRARAWSILGHGVFRASPREALPIRLQHLHQGVQELLERFRPGEAAVEDLFHARNARSALILGHARGVVLLALCQYGLIPASYPALTVKQAITGSGSADKQQVRRWLCRWLGASPQRISTDASDALAVALCHARARAWPAAPATRVSSRRRLRPGAREP